MGIDRHGIVGQPIGWFEQYRCPGNGAILGCHVWTGDIVHQSIALGPSRSEAYFQAIADGQIHDPRYLPQVMAAHMTLDIAFQLIGRLLGDEEDRAGCAVASEKGSLWAGWRLYGWSVPKLQINDVRGDRQERTSGG